MCGIYCSLSQSQHILPSKIELELLQKRGPDACNTVRRVVPAQDGVTFRYLTFCSTVLSLRGDHVVQQPCEDSSSTSLLCWNGEAWRYDGKDILGSDAQFIFDLLLEAVKETSSDDDRATSTSDTSMNRILSVLSKISGPFAFVFYDGRGQRVFFGRDVLGRRTLLTTTASDGSIIISSVSGDFTNTTWGEVEADGIYTFDIVDQTKSSEDVAEILSQDYEILATESERITWSPKDCDTSKPRKLISPFSAFNGECPISKPPILGLDSPAVLELADLLTASLSNRVQDIPNPPSAATSTRLAILFSGGLDCTLLARLCHDILPKTHEIDLLNVAFENPRVVKAAARKAPSDSTTVYSTCPDRLTGHQSHAELLRVCPGRTWRFVTIDVPYEVLLAHRPQIQFLIRPHNTEMDLSIASALYFAARGDGTAHGNNNVTTDSYSSPARVLLSGLGADELFGGYTRHATAFARRGYEGLTQELELDFQRLSKRNLGRDDRVISHWGKEVRYPYLDEILVEWALRMPVWTKCGFGQTVSNKVEDKSNQPLEPAKMALRLLALKLGMSEVAFEKKRAIQFGARTAKMESGRSKGTQALP